ncbi:MAG: M23 family metallopeptidase [Termitinemataceae bacterium]|nr:MAG: M23 family metallopeptidase [Termitinemataceae bacterium]
MQTHIRKRAGAIPWLFFYVFLTAHQSFAEDYGVAASASLISDFPQINRLQNNDVVFKQFQDDVAIGRRITHSGKTSLYPGAASAQSIADSLTIYSFVPRDKSGKIEAFDMDIYRLSSRCTLPYSAITTLNRISKDDLSYDVPVLLPSVPGIFIPEDPSSDLEKLIASSRGDDAGVPITITFNGKKTLWRFIPGDDFSQNERTFFVNPKTFSFPLKNWRLTSAFGMRVSPISGKTGIHKGLDLAAPAGTDVFAARAGTVIELNENAVYGKYIIISHDNGYTSLYGHLFAITTTLNSKLSGGALIGKVGSTGLSTGPHLHFELRLNGKPLDPSTMLNKKQP